MEEYQIRFESISTKISGISESWLISSFIVGLCDSIRCELLIISQPDSYFKAVSLAKLYEKNEHLLSANNQ